MLQKTGSQVHAIKIKSEYLTGSTSFVDLVIVFRNSLVAQPSVLIVA
jgi:hypothetical protein